MNKFLSWLILLFCLSNPILQAGRGGSSFAGGMAGGMMGGLISGAMTSSSRGDSRRAEEEARRAQYKTETLEREQDRGRYEDLRRDMMERQILARDRAASRTIIHILVIALILLFLAVIGLGIVVFRRRR